MAQNSNDPLKDLDRIEAPFYRSENTRRLVDLLEQGYHIDSSNLNYVPCPRSMKHVCDLEKQIESRNGKTWTRNFQPLEVLPRKFQRPEGEIWGFEISVRDESDPDPMREAIRPFTLRSGRAVRGNTDTQRQENSLLTADIFEAGVFSNDMFDAKEEALRLAYVTCDVMNKTPLELPLNGWNSLSGEGLANIVVFVEVVSLMVWKPDFDFNLLHSDWISDDRTLARNVYKSRMRSNAGSEITNFFRSYARLFFVNTEDPNFPAEMLSVGVAGIDWAAVQKVCQIPHGFWFANKTTPDHRVTNDIRDEAAYQLLRWVVFRTVGHCGTSVQLRNFIDDLIRPFTKSGEISRREHGPLSGRGLFNAPSVSGHQVIVRPTLALYERCFENNDASAHEKSQSTLAANMTSNSTILHAYVCQEGLDSLAKKKSLKNTILAFLQAADRVNRREITESEAIAQHCSDQHPTQDRACMICSNIRSKPDMSNHPENGALVCVGCITRSGPFTFYRGSDASDQLRGMINFLYTFDGSRGRDVAWKREDMYATLVKKFIHSTYEWRNGYGDHVFDVREATYPESSSVGRTRKHPLRPSPDRLLPLYIADGIPHLHHPDNVALVFQCINFLRGTDILHMIPWYKRLRALKESVQHLEPQAEYHDEVREEYLAFERAADNALVIKYAVPNENKARLRWGDEKAFQREFMEVWAPQNKSGVLSAKPPARFGFYTRRHIIKGGTRQPRADIPPFPDFKMWTASELDNIKRLILQAHSPKYNPHNLTLPLSADGSPRFFREDSTPQDSCWEFVFQEIRARLWTWWHDCDDDNDTQESPTTILIFFVLQWLKHGGKCHIFGFKFVPFAGHTQAYSFGRGVYIYNESGDVVRPIMPKEALSTGFNTTNPTDLDLDWDPEACTAMVESWKANSLRHEYPVSALHLCLEAVRMTVDDSDTEFFDAPKPISSYVPIVFPNSWKHTTLSGKSADDSADLDAAGWDEEMPSRVFRDVTGRESLDPKEGILARQILIRRRQKAGCVINPWSVPHMAGRFSFLQDKIDGRAAKILGYGSARAVTEAIVSGELGGIEPGANPKIQPLVVFQPREDLLNPTRQPREPGRWMYLTPEDKRTASRLFLKYPNPRYFVNQNLPTAEELWNFRLSKEATGKIKEVMDTINITWGNRHGGDVVYSHPVPPQQGTGGGGNGGNDPPNDNQAHDRAGEGDSLRQRQSVSTDSGMSLDRTSRPSTSGVVGASRASSLNPSLPTRGGPPSGSQARDEDTLMGGQEQAPSTHSDVSWSPFIIPLPPGAAARGTSSLKGPQSPATDTSDPYGANIDTRGNTLYHTPFTQLPPNVRPSIEVTESQAADANLDQGSQLAQEQGLPSRYMSSQLSESPGPSIYRQNNKNTPIPMTHSTVPNPQLVRELFGVTPERASSSQSGAPISQHGRPGSQNDRLLQDIERALDGQDQQATQGSVRQSTAAASREDRDKRQRRQDAIKAKLRGAYEEFERDQGQ
ncbi:hypothetical protein KCU78_g2039, partial [Aureobasidium melanogenum]